MKLLTLSEVSAITGHSRLTILKRFTLVRGRHRVWVRQDHVEDALRDRGISGDELRAVLADCRRSRFAVNGR